MKTIWITGGSTGIGAATAKKFNENNWRVIISSRNENLLVKTKENIIKNSKNKEVYIFPCDISKRNEVYKIVKNIEEKHSIDLALLNAAAYSPNKNQDFDIENYNLLIDVNLKGTLNCIDVLKNFLKPRNKGHIAIVSSPAPYVNAL